MTPCPNKKSAQSILDFVLAFIALAVLVVGIARIWVWFNVNYAKRQLEYQQSRIVAGTPETKQGKTSYQQPIDIGATELEPTRRYYPLDLTEEWVFKGQPSGSVTAGLLNPPTYISPSDYCRGTEVEPGYPQPCGDISQHPECFKDGYFDTACACYVQCYCETQMKPTIDNYEDQIVMLCGEDMNCSPCDYEEECKEHSSERQDICGGQACMLRVAAQQMWDRAEECDDPWDFCFWNPLNLIVNIVTWEKTQRELKNAAKELRRTAADLEAQGNSLIDKISKTEECCRKDTLEEQDDCLTGISTGECPTLTNSYYINWDTYVNDLNQDILDIQSTSQEIDQVLGDSHLWAKSQCEDICVVKCTDPGTGEFNQDCFNQCIVSDSEYLNCFYPKKDEYCRNNCCQNSTWQRDCQSPVDNCDADCGGYDKDNPENCAKCGLSEYQRRANEEIPLINSQIDKLNQLKNKIGLCCYDCSLYEDNAQCLDAQWACISAVTACANFYCESADDPEQCLADQQACIDNLTVP